MLPGSLVLSKTAILVTVFGKEYTFSTNVAELDATSTTGLILYGGGIQKIMTAGDTATLDVDGQQAVINVVGVNTDNSDAMIDYFDTAFYTNISIGKWNKPYEYKGAK